MGKPPSYDYCRFFRLIILSFFHFVFHKRKVIVLDVENQFLDLQNLFPLIVTDSDLQWDCLLSPGISLSFSPK